MDLVKVREISKKLTRVPKIVCYSSRKWPETDVFREVIKFKTVWPGDLPWLFYKLWSEHGGGTVRVTKCAILSSGMVDSNSRLER
jgi:hypothetical protein